MNDAKIRVVGGNAAMQLPLQKSRCFQDVVVTPEIATHWLTFNTSNRGIFASRLEEFKAAIIAGAWADNGEAVKFAHGKLLDGQHRLMAIAVTGKAQKLSVVCGLAPETQVTMDTGRSRTPRDVLSIEGMDIWSAGVCGSAIHGIITAENGGLPSSPAKYPNRVVKAFFLEHRAELERTVRFLHDMPHRPMVLSFSRAATFHYLFSKIDKDRADWFFSRLYIGDALKTTSPVFHLRNVLMNDWTAKSKKSVFIQCYHIVAAWNAVRKDASWKTPTCLYPRDNTTMTIA